MFNAEGSFARKQLEKHGWTEGSGLGSSQQGISQAIRVKIKKDTTGVGHDPVKEFSHHWWDHAFNKAAASLVVENGEDGVMVKKKERTQKERSAAAKKVLYGNFIKSSMLNNGLETKVEREGGDADSSEDESRPKIQILMLPDDELLQVCGGRTAHKGARHGLKLNGKLARIQEQERLLAGKNSNSHGTSPTTSYSPSQNGTTDSLPSTIEDSSETKRKKKKKKRKLEDEHAESEGRGEDCEGEVMDIPEQSEDVASSVSKKKKKRKKRRKEERAENEGVEKEKRQTQLAENETDVKQVAVESRSSCPVTEEDSSTVKKRKIKSQSSEVCSDGSELQKADGSSDVKKRKKKAKSKSSEVCSDNSSDTQKQDAPEERKRNKKSGSNSADVCCDSSDSQTKSKGEVCLDSSVSLFNGAGCRSSADDELKETRKKSKKKKKSKSVQ